ncbi:MAG TPA: hypothetical protein VME46_14695 [Acidimicrobiales bacterium]|nr:hypothetical protein [Acidimicrobiales bacterium]
MTTSGPRAIGAAAVLPVGDTSRARSRPLSEQAPSAACGSGLRAPRRPRRPVSAGHRLVDQIEAGPTDDPGPGGWSGGFANQAHWDPSRSRDWRCWAQSGPTWSAHCGAEVAADDTLGLCQRHRRSLLEGDSIDEYCPSLLAETVLSAS